MKKYMIYNKKADFNALGEKYNIDPVVARVAINRDVKEEDFDRYINPSLDDLHNPHLLRDADKAASIIKNCIDAGQKIRIIGDYDVDGVNATYILLVTLSKFGALVDYAIPDRIEDGYGINPNIVKKAINDGIKCIVTCDNGVSAIEAFELARSEGVTCVITDHHELMFEETDGVKRQIKPDVDALVNPKQEGDQYPFSGICGATVAWKLCQCLYELYGCSVEQSFQLLENVAFATVGDVMDLVDENRAIVRFGLQELTNTSNYGFKALIEGTNLQGPINTFDVGFVLGPCINASGRLDSARHAVDLLLSEDIEEARNMAQLLISLNEERKDMTLKATDTAINMVNEEFSCDKILVLYIPNIHESICGIVAGRVREAFDKPTIVLTDGDQAIKGSARSIETYNMYEGLHECRDLFSAFGGHPMAAGLTLQEGQKSLIELRQRLNDNCLLTETDFISKEMIDVAMPLSYISYKLIDDLDKLEPFGNGNKKPCFAVKDVDVISARYIGKDSKYLKFTLNTGAGHMDALCFKDSQAISEKLIAKFGQVSFENMLAGIDNPISISFTYYPSINEYRGFKNIQVVIRDLI